MNEQGKVKLPRESYQYINDPKNSMGVKSLNEKPQIDFIIQKLKNKDFYILLESKPSEKLPGSVVSTAPILHKSLVIEYPIGDKIVLIRLGMFTSTKDSNNILLSKTQEINIDPDTRNKEQRFLQFPSFLIVENNEPRRIDIKATLYAQGINLEGDSVHQILLDLYERTKNTWSNNPFQESFIVTKDALRKITKSFYDDKLKILQEELNVLSTRLNKLSEDKKEIELTRIQTEKDKELVALQNQQYFSKLKPKELQTLLKALKVFENIEEKQNQINAEKQVKKDAHDALIKHKKTLALQKTSENKTAKEKKKST